MMCSVSARRCCTHATAWPRIIYYRTWRPRRTVCPFVSPRRTQHMCNTRGNDACRRLGMTNASSAGRTSCSSPPGKQCTCTSRLLGNTAITIPNCASCPPLLLLASLQGSHGAAPPCDMSHTSLFRGPSASRTADTTGRSRGGWRSGCATSRSHTVRTSAGAPILLAILRPYDVRWRKPHRRPSNQD